MEEHKHVEKKDNTMKILSIMIGLLLLIALYNGFKFSNISKQATNSGSVNINVNEFASVIPKGIPIVYGAELGVSYDDVSVANPTKADQTIRKLGDFDNAITLTRPGKIYKY